MYRLIDDIARRRILYPALVPGFPGIMLIDLPLGARGSGLLLGRYYAAVIETTEEGEEMEAYLAAPRRAPVRPALLDRRPSSIRSDHAVVMRFEPPTIAWPWVTLCRWPESLTAGAPATRDDTARGCYTFEAFPTPEASADHQAEIIKSLARFEHVQIQQVAANSLSKSGSA